MSDVRSLLKAKRQEIRIDHPLASYTSSGQLRCIVCETNIKHPSAWDGHLGSKAHRTNAVRIREEERRRKELELEEEANRLKRKVLEDDMDEDIDTTTSTAKKSRITPTPQPSTSGLPLDFFSDPSRAPLSSLNDSDDEEETGATAVTTKPTSGGGDSALDQEWIQFQQSLINSPDAAATYDRATIFAEPELVSDPTEGFPDDTDAVPVARVDEGGERRRKDQEERELIMDRLLDEEQAQEEADMKVAIMKNRLAALRQRREASRSAKSNVGVA
ncbi:hypothetical protein JVT61DRAFT_12085 [Boletus reticuloceps]|uniref:Coiled-coil domain-containing protein 16 n=1 Tax=Boletus reticuloceps TaxID=495285 RepID=A0A8I2YEK7_9AGAM|nr:hypothetical protein JVT61DRAFT_12085 [Boletus reticuloceps]